MKRRRGRPPHDDLLTPAEWRTVHAVRHGLRNQQIANLRGISLDAVKYHVANAIAKLGVTNRRALKAWVGAPKTSRVKESTMQHDTFPNYLGIGQVARSVADVQESEAWYSDVLGLDHLYTFGNLAFFDCGGTRIMLSQAEDKPGDESIVYLRVADIHATHQRLAEAGVEFINTPHMIHQHDDGAEEWMAFFKDPEGRPLGLMAVTEPAD
jgi:DNA-binding CsgD family transcriptional regulator/catechol 2,3-dioxygenase-like lactoylglutathione lyase family enzyme